MAAFGIQSRSLTAREAWRAIVEQIDSAPRLREHKPALDVILERGPLARRIVARTGDAPSRSTLSGVYHELADCLATGRMFV